jgi:hypothetical protein
LQHRLEKALTTPTEAAAIAAAVRVVMVTPGTTKSTTIRLRAVASPDSRMLHIFVFFIAIS